MALTTPPLSNDPEISFTGAVECASDPYFDNQYLVFKFTLDANLVAIFQDQDVDAILKTASDRLIAARPDLHIRVRKLFSGSRGSNSTVVTNTPA